MSRIGLCLLRTFRQHPWQPDTAKPKRLRRVPHLDVRHEDLDHAGLGGAERVGLRGKGTRAEARQQLHVSHCHCDGHGYSVNRCNTCYSVLKYLRRRPCTNETVVTVSWGPQLRGQRTHPCSLPPTCPKMPNAVHCSMHVVPVYPYPATGATPRPPACPTSSYTALPSTV